MIKVGQDDLKLETCKEIICVCFSGGFLWIRSHGIHHRFSPAFVEYFGDFSKHPHKTRATNPSGLDFLKVFSDEPCYNKVILW